MATVSDQCVTNVAAINILLKETQQYWLQTNTENKYGGYLINEHEIVLKYDPSHLLKSICNNLLTKKC